MPELEVLPDAGAVAARTAALIAERARSGVAARGSFSLAVSRLERPPQLGDLLSAADVPWQAVTVYQVDERIAPHGDQARNFTLVEGVLPAELRPMPVEEEDLDRAAAEYASSLPPQLDLVHLGLGDDGHTASLLPGDPAADVADRDVAVTGEYQGHRRMTLTFPALDRALEAVWVVTGEAKRDALARLLDGDQAIPAARVRTPLQIVIADRAAAGR